MQHSRQRETELSELQKSIAQLNIFALAHRDMWFGGETLKAVLYTWRTKNVWHSDVLEPKTD